MMQMPLPLTKELVLIGGGHSHALVLRKWGMTPLPGARLTLINPGPVAPYTGMLPGFVAGHYQRDDLMIDLVRLARFAGARLVFGAVTGIDRAAQEIHVPDRAPIAYDLASINVGITSDLPDLPGFTDHAVGAKPLGGFADKWDSFLNALPPQPANIVVIGGGVGGVELALSMAYRLTQLGQQPNVTVIDRSSALPGLGPRARSAMLDHMAQMNIRLVENTQAIEVTPDSVLLNDGSSLPSHLTVGVAGARPQGWLTETGLDLQDGFITVDETLRSSDSAIFAAGDCAHLPDPRPKAGVFAVREAPILHHNLRAALTGGQVKPFRPQKSYLKLISLGGKTALADKYDGRLSGPWVWRWKDWIDQRFMNRFRQFPDMVQPALPSETTADMAQALGDKPMCGGCGAKVGGATLASVVENLPTVNRDDILSAPGDDAAVLSIDGTHQVLTTDHLRAFTEDPWDMARITAVHALGDIWAMGAKPQAALASVILPKMTDRLQGLWLAEIMAAAGQVFADAGAEIVGGHTTLGPELTIGFSVTGLLNRPAITLAGARPGDQLILTKPIGSGTILAAEMAMKARGDWVADTVSMMTQEQGTAAQLLSKAHAMTDVTGFGLAGHLMGICRASGVAATLSLKAVPTCRGAIELSENGVRSTLYPENRRIAEAMSLPLSAKSDLLFDPQTAGGLLAVVPPEGIRETLQTLIDAGYPAVRIGEITAGDPFITVV